MRAADMRERMRARASRRLCRLDLLLHLAVRLLKLLGLAVGGAAALHGLGEDEHAAGRPLRQRRGAQLLRRGRKQERRGREDDEVPWPLAGARMCVLAATTSAMCD